MAAEFDYIVIGAGAGGGPLACNLAMAPEGFRVALLEAGGDPAEMPESYHYFNYSIPGLHARASEDPDMSWSFFVQHYADANRQRPQFDSKYAPGKGIFYPRAAAVGGCTAHHAMITVYPHNKDWERLQALTGDPSWSPESMRRYFEHLEDCQYLTRTGEEDRDPTTRHGFGGWLPVSMPDPTLALGDEQLLKLLVRTFLAAQIAERQPNDAALLVDEKVRGLADNKKRIGGLLDRAIDHFLDTARKTAETSASSVRDAISRLSAEVSKLKGQIPSGPDLFQDFVENGHLLELFRLVHVRLDPNRWFEHDAERTGVFNTPASIRDGVRSAVRERVMAVRALFPDRLVLLTHTLASQVIIENGRAVGVHCLDGPYLYGASSQGSSGSASPAAYEIRLRERGEVILAGGAFNSPQLLQLSGIGPAERLRSLGIEVHCDLPGVGRNLHDRYEISVVSELQDDFKVLDGSKFEASDGNDVHDKGLQEWLKHRGVYASNGVVLSIIKKSSQAEGEVPDLFLFGVPGFFKGYFPGYSLLTQSAIANGVRTPNHRRFTWAILKGSTRNRNGEVALSSKDPRVPPSINFKYFDEGSTGWEKDLQALSEGVRFAGNLMRATGLKFTTISPPPTVNINDPQQLVEFIKKEAWGHHACGTCKIGSDANAVLDGNFRVRGVQNLRVVDASVFPDIPGFFIVTPIYMISEKASDVLLADRRAPKPPPWPQPVRSTNR